MFSSKKTTILGILGLISLIASSVKAQFDNDPMTVPQWGEVISAAMLCFGLIAAKDSNVTGGSISNGMTPDPKNPS